MTDRGTRRWALMMLTVALVLVAGLGPTAPMVAPAQAVRSSYPSGQGLTVLSATEEGARIVRLVVGTDALGKPVRVSILLPDGYATSTRRYPVLYLLHGTSGGADDWLAYGDVAATTAGQPLIVVMPDGGHDSNGGGWWTDWVDQSTKLGAARWETFHVEQLVPWIDANLRTVASRKGRAIAGLSQGAFGAFSYAARHPDMFVAAGSFSGAVDIARNPLAKVIGPTLVGAIMGLNGVQPFAPFGDPVLNHNNWLGHNPASLVGNLHATDLQLWTGQGPPGSEEQLGPDILAPATIEGIVHASTLFFAQAANAEGIDYELTDYGPGTHTWPYWRRDLQEYLPRLMAVFAAPPARPQTIDYRSTDRTYAEWGWRVAVTRRAPAKFTGLVDAGVGGFTYTGADPATVTTPPSYEPGRSYRVVVGTTVTQVRAGTGGRLTIAIPQPGLQSPRVPVAIG